MLKIRIFKVQFLLTWIMKNWIIIKPNKKKLLSVKIWLNNFQQFYITKSSELETHINKLINYFFVWNEFHWHRPTVLCLFKVGFRNGLLLNSDHFCSPLRAIEKSTTLRSISNFFFRFFESKKFINSKRLHWFIFTDISSHVSWSFL